jgi:RNA polymerase sigma-70 factor (sigma-E family)
MARTDRSDRSDFDAFARARSRPLLQASWLLTGDWQLAEDLLQTSLVKVYLAWGRIRREGNAEAYARRVLVTTWLTGRRRRWHREVATGTVPDVAGSLDDFAAVDLRSAVVQALAALPRRQRAVVVLRYYCDLSERDTAEALGCSEGTVKSQAAKGLAALRRSGLSATISEGNAS